MSSEKHEWVRLLSNIDPDLTLRITTLERKIRVALIATAASSTMCVFAVLGTIRTRAVAVSGLESKPSVTNVLRARELDIVDKNGTTRVKLASPLPAPVIAGDQKKGRGGGPAGTMSGVLLFDAEGVERSGYATVDQGYSNVLLTLDDKTSQHAMFIAEPTGATTLRLFNSGTKDRVDIAIDKDGPSISMRRQNKKYRVSPQ